MVRTNEILKSDCKQPEDIRDCWYHHFNKVLDNHSITDAEAVGKLSTMVFMVYLNDHPTIKKTE